jgi:hypothetical protein
MYQLLMYTISSRNEPRAWIPSSGPLRLVTNMVQRMLCLPTLHHMALSTTPGTIEQVFFLNFLVSRTSSRAREIQNRQFQSTTLV